MTPICRECEWVKINSNIVAECNHPDNIEFCCVQGKMSHRYNNYRLNMQGQCTNFEQKTEEPTPIKSWWRRLCTHTAKVEGATR